MNTNIKDFNITNIKGIEDSEEDKSVNYYVPFCIVMDSDKKDEEVQLYLDYDILIDLAIKLKPYLDNYNKQIEEDKNIMETNKIGTCENPECSDKEQVLYKLGGNWICGGCANEYEHDKAFYDSEYPQD